MTHYQPITTTISTFKPLTLQDVEKEGKKIKAQGKRAKTQKTKVQKAILYWTLRYVWWAKQYESTKKGVYMHYALQCKAKAIKLAQL